MRGLRGRLTLALALTSAGAVALAAVLLLAPLDRRLRDDQLTSLTQTARSARGVLDNLHIDDPQRLPLEVSALHRRTTADVAIVDGGLNVLGASDRDPDDRYLDAGRAIRTDALVSGLSGNEALVAMPFSAGDRRLALVLRRPLQEVDGARDVVSRSLLTAAIVAVAIAALLGGVIATGMVRRLSALRRAALEGFVPDDDGSDEIADLARAFGTMQERLDAQEQARRTFVATASHELRTPLSSLGLMLHGAAEDLAVEPPDVIEARAQVVRALGQTARLSKLSAELLDLSRIDAGLPLRAEPVELTGLTRSVLGEFPEGAVALAPSAAVWATADPGSVARILRILIDNALRHAREHVRVELGSDATITVSDDGPGVAPGDEERIFERFQRGGEDGSGFGLGLAIGRELARQMGGDLVLRDRATFIASLPVSAEN